MPTFARLPAAPLQRELGRQRRVLAVTLAELATRLDICERTLARLLRAQDLAEPVADRMACRRLHPVLLWPRHWLRDTSGGDRTAS